MKRILTTSLGLFLLFVSTTSGWSGNEAGGGNAVVCRNVEGVIESARLLDYYEAEVLLPHFKIYLGPKEKTETEKVEFVLARLSKLDPTRAIRYQKKTEEFYNETQFVSKLLLPDLNDYGYIPPLAANCKVEQLAVQRASVPPEAKRYLIKQELWEHLSSQDRAGLILHEIIYGEAMKKGHKTSINSRYFNALVSSLRLEQLDQKDYDQRLIDIGLSEGTSEAAPHWVMNPLVVPGATENVPYKKSLVSFVHTPAQSPLTFMKKSGPSWLSVNVNGDVVGTPQASNIGLNEFVVSASDGKSWADVVLRITVVKHQQQVPIWVASPIDLGVQQEEIPWSFDLRSMVKDVDGATLTFNVQNLPSWMSLESTGRLYGVPKRADIGKYSGVSLTATNSQGASATVEALGEVLKTNHPAKWMASVMTFPDALEDRLYSVNLWEWVLNSTEGKVQFGIIGEKPSWLKLSGGHLVGTPTKADLGEHVIKVMLKDDEHGDIAQVRIKVVHANHAPYWLKNPIVFYAKPKQPFAASLSPYAADIDGDVLVFSKMIGPAWLMMTSSGILTGTPTLADVGESSFNIRLSDGSLTSTVTVIIKMATDD